MNSPDASILQVSRLIKAPCERVFAAWTTPDQVRHWFGPSGCRVLDAQIDLRPGGKYRFTVTSDSYGERAVGGEYREITAPSKLVFTWKWEDDEDWANVASVVTVEFVRRNRGTEVRISHEGFPTGESAGRHEHGWTCSLDKLEIRSAMSAELFGPGRFSWNELLTEDVDKAAAFYNSLLGWTPVPMQGGMPYTLFKKNGTDVGGLMKLPMPGIPPHWLNYVTVEACDATVAKATELGAKICAPPFDIPNVGRIAVVQDPQGAAFGLFQPAQS